MVTMGYKKGIDEAICSEYLDTKLRALSPISQHSTRLEVTKATATHLWRSSNCHTPEDDEAIHASSQHLICQSEHGDQLKDLNKRAIVTHFEVVLVQTGASFNIQQCKA